LGKVSPRQGGEGSPFEANLSAHLFNVPKKYKIIYRTTIIYGDCERNMRLSFRVPIQFCSPDFMRIVQVPDND
jgi:hypothetical protein